ncbi:MAG: peptide deformylase, partial [Nitrosopumilaceae archaeon]
MLTILKYPNPILTQKCESVLKFDDELKQFCNEMILTMNNAKGIGLAASQVGKLMRVIVTDIGNKPMIFINP